jgi:ethanolamine utilization microcompartment shell protein EutS
MGERLDKGFSAVHGRTEPPTRSASLVPDRGSRIKEDIMPTPTIGWAVDADGDWSNTADWTPARLPNSTDNVSINTAHLHTVTHSTGTDSVSSLTVGNDNFVMSGGSLTIGSTASFANQMAMSAGALTIGRNARFAGQLAMSGGTLALKDAQIANLAWSGGTLQLHDRSVFVTGPTVITSTVSEGGTGVIVLKGSASLASGSVLTVGANLAFGLSGNATLGGSVTGGGFLDFFSGMQTIESGATITMANWYIYSGDVVTLGEDLADAGTFVLSEATMALGGHTLDLSGGVQFGGGTTGVDAQVTGAGRLNTRGATTIEIGHEGGLNLGAGVTWTNYGNVSQNSLEAGVTGAGRILNAVIGVYDLAGNSGIVATSFLNKGVLEKTGGIGTSVIDAPVENIGTISVAIGALEFDGGVTGDGSMKIGAGATLKVEGAAASTLTVRFFAGVGTLDLRTPSAFAATLHGFAPTDTIDLLNTAATAATLGAGDTLVITDNGAAVATLQLGGIYTGDTFNVASDGNGGTNITVTSGPAHAAQFIAAMAGLGGDSHGPVSTFSEVHSTRPPMLVVPRMAMA